MENQKLICLFRKGSSKTTKSIEIKNSGFLAILNNDIEYSENMI